MKNILLLFTLIFLSVDIAFSQTRKETEDWIIEKFNSYRRPENIENQLEIADGILYHYNATTKLAMRVPIKDIKEIEIKQESWGDGDFWVNIYLYTDTNKMAMKSFSKYSPDEYYNITPDTKTHIPLSNKFYYGKMFPRMEKALLHLIKLNGGNAVIKNEPF